MRGMSSQAIADQLTHHHLIHNPWVFLFVTHLSDASHRLQVGTYRLSAAMSIPQIIDHLKTGKVVTRQFGVPEGLTVVQIGKLWEKVWIWYQQQRSTKLRTIQSGCRDIESIRGKTLEGYLFPNTYQFPDGATPEVILEIMLDEFDRRWTA